MSTFKEEYLQTRKEVIARDFPRLNERQREAVMATEGPLLILAGAGSGKTTVLMNRVANLMKYGRASDCDELPPEADEQSLHDMRAYLDGDDSLRRRAEEAAAYCPVKPWQILAITFTNKAAGEMKDRLRRMLGDLAEDIWARTFHSACVRILRKNIDRLGYPSAFTIYDTADREAVMKRLIKEKGLDDKSVPAKWVLSVIDKAKDRMQSPGMLREASERMGDQRMVAAAGLYRAYTDRLKADGAVDFEDLIYLTVRLLQEHPDVLEYYQRHFRYVMVDEYQDTNHLQYLLASLLAGGHKNICVVGDDDQSIYAFRGATIDNILSFDEQYTGARVIRLEQNYRSTGHILKAANSVVANNTERMGKKLWTRTGDGDPVTLYVARNEMDEAQYVVRQILQDVQYGGSLGDHAVLYRTNAQSRALEQAFLRNGIRPHIVKGNAFFERAEIKDLMAYFFVLLNPSDELRLTRIINNPPRGIGNTTVERAQTLAAQNGLPLFTVVSMAEQFPELARAREKLKAFADMMNELYTLTATKPLDELYDAIIEKTGYVRMLTEKPTEENRNRLENVRELKSFIVSHINDTGDNTLSGFLDEVSLYTDLQGMGADENAVSLMTVHSAKGLEFDTVFLTGMEEGVFPSLQAIGESAQMQEERRLAYVGITRAKRHLYLTAARQRMVFGQTAAHRISRFVDEIPREHIERPEANLRPSWFDFSDIPQADPEPQWEPQYDSQWEEPVRQQPARPQPAWQLPARKPLERQDTRPAARSVPSYYDPPKRPSSAAKKVDTSLTLKPRRAEPMPELHPGDTVEHSAFHRGTVVRIQPMGGDALIEVEFEEAGKKRLMLKAAMAHMKKV